MSTDLARPASERSRTPSRPSHARVTPEHGGGQHEALLKPEAVARLLACSPKSVYAWAARGLLPCVRLGRLVRFRPSDVRRFVEANMGDASQGKVSGWE